MSDPRVTERRNPLVDRMNEIAEFNRVHGTRRQGRGLPPAGELPPSPVAVEGGSGTMLPPAPRPMPPVEEAVTGVTQAELDDLERAWAADPTNPANRKGAPEPVGHGDPRGRAPSGPIDSFGIGVAQVIDLAAGALRTNTGRSIPIHPEALREIRLFAYRATMQAIVDEANTNLKVLREALGLPDEPAQPEGEQGAEVPPVSGGEAAAQVPPGPNNVPRVRKPRKGGAGKAASRKGKGSKRAPQAVVEGTGDKAQG